MEPYHWCVLMVFPGQFWRFSIPEMLCLVRSLEVDIQTDVRSDKVVRGFGGGT